MRALRQTLMQLKNHIGREKGRVVWSMRSLAKTAARLILGRLKVRLSEHKQAVKRGDPKNGIMVHVHESHHSIDWDGATVEENCNQLLAEKSYGGHPGQLISCIAEFGFLPDQHGQWNINEL